MPKITLENGTVVEISEASYKELQEATKKDWRDAFLGIGIENTEKVEYSCTIAIKINRCSSCTSPRMLMKYVLLFEFGGFWYGPDGLHFVTNGAGNDPKATYQHAKTFIEEN